MQKILFSTLIIAFLSVSACTNMSRTQQGALSGGAIGAGAGLGIAAITGGSLGLGALLGGGIGAVAGGLYGNDQERHDRHRN
ncbi:MAG: cell envelope biogenesis protein OmpA [Alphaproteobacteria bacterium]|nr:cell envelope biogenesis protein OmpA [Desulfovibrionaceae bacterium]MBF0514417.1 cell envelope biogenesis protein OmpA [Desulfovibrionaceae bacterium]MBF0562554.1 cell envelope biogenesis protein OmpA [Alphaproteobacteria bacterium]